MALIHLNEESFDTTMDSGKLMLVDFWATWCGPCRMLGPVIEELAEEYEGKDVVICKVDVDENPELTRRYGVMQVPTVLLLQDGEELAREIGVRPMEVYTELLDEQL